MPEQVFDALKAVLAEFGEANLDLRLDWFAKGDDHEREMGRQLLRAFQLVENWHNNPAMTSDGIRKSLEQSDNEWKILGKKSAAA
jgi:hypothetical protein